MGENVVVGAGLSGLVAAINLAREGREVLVLEREERPGGSPMYHPSPQGTPVDLEGLASYTGIDIGSAAAPLETGRSVSYGEMIGIDPRSISAYMVERGRRGGSLDNLLYEQAKRDGVRFEFGHPVVSDDAMALLPPDSIIATGLHFEGFDALRVPYLTSFHYTARQEVPGDGSNHVTLYHGSFTGDYGYTCSMNGIRFAHLFQRAPIGRGSLKAFEEQVFLSEGFEFAEWNEFTFPVPAAGRDNPRLFAGNKVLAGTLSGCQEPFMFFGILGALVSGKIAAMALTDRARAYREFTTASQAFTSAYLVGIANRMLPHPVRRRALAALVSRLKCGSMTSRVLREAVPGWRNCQAPR